MKELIIATRKSQLALWQSEWVKSFLEKEHNIKVVLEGFKTKGDILLDSPLAKIGGKGLFTKELEQSMLEKKAHLAVHSLKDVPSFFPEGLKLVAISKREESNDAMLSQKYPTLKDLPKNAKIGTTSLRRKMQLLLLRPDLNIISLRGNVNSRIDKLKNGEFDAIVLALAGVKRLNLDSLVNYVSVFSKDEMIPAASQGALGIEALDMPEIVSLLECLNNENSVIETTIERDFIRVLEGGCQVPIGINAQLLQDKIHIRAILGLPDASEFLKEDFLINKSDFKSAGEKLALKFISLGAKDLLKRAEAMI